MKKKILDILKERNMEYKNYNIDKLYNIGIKNIMNNIEFYYDKPYTCESVLNELFIRGIIEYIEKNHN